MIQATDPEHLDANHMYFLAFFERTFKDKAFSANVLDYGCGDGRLIIHARRLGFSFWGAETFYAEDQEYIRSLSMEHVGFLVDRLNGDGHTRYPNDYFDFVYSNQVLEHVQDLKATLCELKRIAKPGGLLIHNFPTSECIYEGHCGIPFFHWFRNDSPWRSRYARFLLGMGFGFDRPVERSVEEWLRRYSHFVDTRCFYRSERTVVNMLKENFNVVRIEKAKILYHLQCRSGLMSRILRALVEMIPAGWVTTMQKRRGSITVLCEKPMNSGS